jgi:hypothetical protein
LQWIYQGTGAQGLEFVDREGQGVTVGLREQPGRAIGSVQMKAAECSFTVAHREDSDFLYADIRLCEGRETHSLMPGGKDDPVCLLNDELMSGGKHKVFLKAVAAIAKAF